MRIPADFPTVNAWCEIQQNTGAGIGNGPLSIGFRNGRLALEKSLSQTYGSVDLGVVWSSAPVVRDQWIKLMIRVKWWPAGDGFYELFGDLADGAGFHQIVPLTPGWTLKFGADGVSPVTVGSRIGIYRLAQPVTSTIYFDGFTVASNRDAATISAFGQPL